MDIEEIRIFHGPSIFSLREPVVNIKVKLGALADVPTRDIKGLNDRIVTLFPGLKDHKCSTGYVGGFLDRLKEGTYLAHVTEHICLELQRIFGYDIKYGKARQVKDDIYNVIFACRHPSIGKACGIFAINTLNRLIDNIDFEFEGELESLKKVCKKYEYNPNIQAIVEKARKRGIPVNKVDDGDFIRLGYGKYQKYISTKSTDEIDSILPEDGQFTIPIISITGTNGKTTTTRMIAHILRHHGFIVGVTTTHGIYINGKCIEEGDTTGPRSAGRILNDREVEAAVLETARGGIVRAGLAYEKADIAVFTNLTEDHLGIDDINTMEELLNVKSLVIEAVKEDGASVLNADDSWVMKAKEKAKGNVILYSMDYNNPAIIEHMNRGGAAVYKKGNSIYLSSKGFVREITKINEIPATLGGALKHNIYNSMAAIGACCAAGISFNTIRQALSEFSSNASTNPGRFNIFDMGDFKVVLDYGHNIDGYRVTIEGLKTLNPERLVGIIGIPGDRRNEDIRKIGLISGESFDRIIIKEDNDLRDRARGEVAGILLEGVLESGRSKGGIEIIHEEKSALKSALQKAKKGDVIVMFFEKMEPLVEMIEDFNREGKEEVNEVNVPVLV
ncbi:MAG: Mur ligase family protein [Clostridia bacterium]|nr:Mur ligase family protein [Clostridia bacterium]